MSLELLVPQQMHFGGLSMGTGRSFDSSVALIREILRYMVGQKRFTR